MTDTSPQPEPTQASEPTEAELKAADALMPSHRSVHSSPGDKRNEIAMIVAAYTRHDNKTSAQWKELYDEALTIWLEDRTAVLELAKSAESKLTEANKTSAQLAAELEESKHNRKILADGLLMVIDHDRETESQLAEAKAELSRESEEKIKRGSEIVQLQSQLSSAKLRIGSLVEQVRAAIKMADEIHDHQTEQAFGVQDALAEIRKLFNSPTDDEALKLWVEFGRMKESLRLADSLADFADHQFNVMTEPEENDCDYCKEGRAALKKFRLLTSPPAKDEGRVG